MITSGQADYWNRHMGRRTGHAWSSTRTTPQVQYTPENVQRLLHRVGSRMGTGAASSGTSRAYRNALRGISGSPMGSSNPAKIESQWNDIYNRLTNDYSNAINVQNTVAATAAENQEEDSDRSWVGNLWNMTGIPDIWNQISDASHGDWITAGSMPGNIQNRIVNILGRPTQAIWGGLTEAAKHGTFASGNPTLNLPTDVITTLAQNPSTVSQAVGNFGAGALRGIAGLGGTNGRLYGGGTIYEAYKENPDNPASTQLRALEEAHPTLESWLSRGTGVTLEATTDPLIYAMPSAPLVTRRGGNLATREGLNAAVAETAAAATDELLNSPSLANHVIQGTPDVIRSRTQLAAEEAVRAATMEIAGGGAAGTRRLNGADFADVVASNVRIVAEEAINADLNEVLTRVLDRNLNPQARNWWANQSARRNSDVLEFFQNAERELIAAGKLKPGDVQWASRAGGFSDFSPIIHLMDNGDSATARIFGSVRDGIHAKYSAEYEQIFQSTFLETANPTYRTLGVRVLGKDIPIKFIGRAYDTAATKLGRNVGGELGSIGKHIYEYRFAGPLSAMATSSRAEAFSALEPFKNDLTQIARQQALTAEQAAQLQADVLPKFTPTNNSQLDAAAQYLRDQYRAMFNEGVAVGSRPHDAVYRPDYTYIHLNGGTAAEREAFYAGRRAAWNDKNTVGPGEYTFEYAQLHGLKPEGNAYMNLLYAYMNHRQTMANSLFHNDLISNYGVFSDRILSEAEAKAVRLQAVSYDDLNQASRAFIDRNGGSYYLPKGMKDVSDLFKDIANWNTSDYNAMLRTYARVIQEFKGVMTLPRPGFHTRNLLSDVAMGVLDGVKFREYAEMIKLMALWKAGKNPHIRLPGGGSISVEDFFTHFRQNADGGYFLTDGVMSATQTVGSRLRNFVAAPLNSLRRLSDMRESFGRLVHYLHAYREEGEALIRKGITGNRLEQEATRAAVWRVNKFKYDYNALMPGEKTMKTFAFPFYTYLRKAIPTLMQQMYMNPRWFVSLNRFMQNNSGMAADSIFNNANTPTWLREMGGLFLPGQDQNEDAPLFMTQDFLPMGAMNIMSGLPNVKNTLQSTLSNLNPLLQIPFEMQSGHELYSGRPIDSNMMNYLLDKIPLLSDIQKEIYDVPGLPGGNPSTAMVNSGDYWNIDRLNNGLTGLGIPLHRISRDQQYQQMQANRDVTIDEPIQEFNQSQDRYHMRYDENGTFSLYDKLQGTLVRSGFPTAQDAIRWAQSNLNGVGSYQEPRYNPLNAPTFQNMDQMMQAIANQGH